MHDPTPCGGHPAAQQAARGARAGVSGPGTAVQPPCALSAHPDLRVGPEPGQVLIVERVPAAPATRALDLLVRNRCHLPIVAPRHACDQRHDVTLRSAHVPARAQASIAETPHIAPSQVNLTKNHSTGYGGSRGALSIGTLLRFASHPGKLLIAAIVRSAK